MIATSHDGCYGNEGVKIQRKRKKKRKREREGKRNEFVARDTKLKNLGSRDKTASETIQISRRARKIRSRS